ncbi:MAG: PhnD/SsuA/transferrin family substrate-binding protein [Cyanobium sp. LacPavin_0920_WC12_MAG_63_22]|nr:PhnD/SsuA/transferrin family substrate-binding protein [Cyanobium sp. LacPavin_0920_WC12_MAG_63_22]
MSTRERLTAAFTGLCLALLPAVLPPVPASLLPAAEAQQVLRIGAIPDQNPEKLNRLYGLVADELAQFYTVFIANARSGIKPIQNQKGLVALKGKRFTFGSESSTSGRLMPQYFLAQAGVKLADFAGGAPGFSGSHDATIALVQSGTYDAGAVNEQVWKSNLRSGKANRSKVVQIWRTPSYPDYLWLGQPNLDQRFGKGFSAKLRQSIISWRPTDPEQKQILSLFGAQQFTTVKPDEYKQIEQVGRQIGKIR